MAFNEPRSINFGKFLATSPNKIFVDRVNGFATGSGDVSSPVQTIAQTVPLLTGNDLIVWEGDPNGALEDQAVFDTARNVAIVSLGGVTRGESGGMRLAQRITGATFISTNVAEFTVGAAHGLSVGNYVVLDVPAADGTQSQEMTGPFEVTAVPNTTTFRCTFPLSLSSGQPPFTGGDLGGVWKPAVVFVDCDNVLVHGMDFSGALNIGNSWTGLAFVNNQVGKNLHVSECSFGRASVAFRALDPFLQTEKPVGSGVRIEACRFTPDFNTVFHPANNTDLSAIYLAGLFDWVVSRCQFNKSLVTAPGGQQTWVAPGLIRVDREPVLNGIVTGCLKGELADPEFFFAGGQAVEQDLVDDGKVAVQQNFFTGQPGGVPLDVSALGILQDQSPAFFPFQFEVSTPTQLITDAGVQATWGFDSVDAHALGVGKMGGIVSVQAFRGAVHVDAAGGSPGTAYPLGTQGDPVDNIADALTIAQANNLDTFEVRGSVTLAQAFQGFTFRGRDPDVDVVDLGGQDVDGSSFERIGVTGTQGGGSIGRIFECNVDNLSGANGTAIRTLLRGTITPAAGGEFNMFEAVAEAPGATFDMSAGGATLGSALFNGIATVANLATGTVTLAFATGLVTLDATCTGGTITLAGEAEVTDNSGGSTVVDLTSSGVRQRFIAETTTGGRVDVDISTDPWTEVHYDQAGTTVVRTYELFDQDGFAINGDEVTGNNPLRDPDVIVARKVLA